MTLCPYAVVSSCSKCPIKKVCPLKSMIGDFKKPEDKSKSQEDNSTKN
jgi:hypothetical protein